jgi:hypothetical protein
MQNQSRTGWREEKMKESRRRNMIKMTGGPKGKMVSLYLLFAENDLLIWCGVLQTKLPFCGVMETKFSLMMCVAQNQTFIVCHRQISRLYVLLSD